MEADEKKLRDRIAELMADGLSEAEAEANARFEVFGGDVVEDE